MKTIEEVIDNIVDEHKECRWMDAGELREYLEVVAQEQKAIDEANPSDAVIMRILNAIGYEEESWIPIVRKNLETMEE